MFLIDRLRKKKLKKALEQSLKEVKLHREGKIHLDTWEEFRRKIEKGDKKQDYKMLGLLELG